ncbi:hypothetical protein F9U64_18550 [Gracilibacillus oryzae]|uniref:Uncharacterized protein n=1 Tax=Gracilibacillus oryzae TaxID=1672701 RepID=A0A7C8GRW8_9BACI|nr:hypothetical protein [Gracilibacillus oryzae]KAB8127095.1 hypothetical protein F9U64_18550 [Gracilibacillus oryzae]
MRNLDPIEWQIASRYLFVDLTLKVIDRDLNMLKKSSLFKISDHYIALLESVQKTGVEERKQLKKQMQQEKIKVILSKKQETFTSYLFTSKGKQEVRNYFHSAIKKKVENILDEWMKQNDRTSIM